MCAYIDNLKTLWNRPVSWLRVVSSCLSTTVKYTWKNPILSNIARTQYGLAWA